MAPTRFRLKYCFAVLALLTAASAAYCAYLANRPNFEMQFVREVPSQASPRDLGKYLWVIQRWPEWFFKAAKVQRVDISGNVYAPEGQLLETGALIRFSMDPKKGKRKRFELVVRVTEYVPEKKISLHLVEDSTGRLTRLFERIDWTIELIPGTPVLIRGTATALTQHWRSRMFGAMAERLVMNQIFYPDLIKLSDITLPNDRNQMPSYMR